MPKVVRRLGTQDLRVTFSYHPADRYWTFQWLEFAVYLLLAGFAFWRTRAGSANGRGRGEAGAGCGQPSRVTSTVTPNCSAAVPE
jgi:hypothetical protein